MTKPSEWPGEAAKHAVKSPGSKANALLKLDHIAKLANKIAGSEEKAPGPGTPAVKEAGPEAVKNTSQEEEAVPQAEKEALQEEEREAIEKTIQEKEPVSCPISYEDMRRGVLNGLREVSLAGIAQESFLLLNTLTHGFIDSQRLFSILCNRDGPFENSTFIVHFNIFIIVSSAAD